MRKESAIGLPLTGHQGFTDEQLTCNTRIDAAVGHTTLRIDREPIDHAALKGHRLTGALFPMRLAPAATQQVGPNLLDPAGLDARRRARIESPGIDHLGCHDPTCATCLRCARRIGACFRCRAGCRTASRQTRARVQPESRGVRAQVMRFIGRPAAQIAEQPRQQRTVQGFVECGRFRRGDRLGSEGRRAPAQFAHGLTELTVHISPFAQLAWREEFALQPGAECTARLAARSVIELTLPAVP